MIPARGSWEDLLAAPPLMLADEHDDQLERAHLALFRLSELHQRALRLRYGFDPGIHRNMTQDEVARELGLSSALMFHTLEMQAFRALRRQLEHVPSTERQEQQNTGTQDILVKV